MITNNFEKLWSKSSKSFTRFKISYVIRMSFACHLYITRMYSTRMSSKCHLYVLVCHPYVTSMYLYVIHMSLACTRISSVRHSYVLVCHRYVTFMWFYHELLFLLGQSVTVIIIFHYLLFRILISSVSTDSLNISISSPRWISRLCRTCICHLFFDFLLFYVIQSNLVLLEGSSCLLFCRTGSQ